MKSTDGCQHYTNPPGLRRARPPRGRSGRGVQIRQSTSVPVQIVSRIGRVGCHGNGGAGSDRKPVMPPCKGTTTGLGGRSIRHPWSVGCGKDRSRIYRLMTHPHRSTTGLPQVYHPGLVPVRRVAVGRSGRPPGGDRAQSTRKPIPRRFKPRGRSHPPFFGGGGDQPSVGTRRTRKK